LSSYVCSISRPLSITASVAANHLLIILLIGVVDNVEEAELVDTLGGRDNTEPISQLLLLEELLCPEPPVSAIVLTAYPASEGDAGILTST
jgi:hypothetical protein